MNALNGLNKIVFLTETLSKQDNLLRIFCQKINWLAENSEYEVYLALTEKNKKPARYELSPQVVVVNLEVNYEQLGKKGFISKPISYWYRQYIHKKRLNEFLEKVKPVATVSMMGKELNFLSRIENGGQKIYEFHNDMKLYMGISKGGITAMFKLFQMWFYSIRLMLLVKKHDVVVVDTESMEQKWKDFFKNIVFIPNPLKEYPSLCGENENMKVMAVGDYLSEKGFNHLIDVWDRISRKYPDWRLHLYGDGNPDYYRDLIKSRHLGKVVQCYGRPEKMFETYPRYSIFVQAYEFDRFGRHLMEAMAYGIPCVAYDVPYGPKDLIDDESNGFLIKPNQLVDFASKLGLLIRKGELREAMGRQAHEDVRRYEVGNVMTEWIKLYDSIAFRKKRHSTFRKNKEL